MKHLYKTLLIVLMALLLVSAVALAACNGFNLNKPNNPSNSDGGDSNTDGQSHMITFFVGEEEFMSLMFNEGDTSVDEPDVPAKDYYTGKWSEYTLGKEDITVYAVYTPKTYTITFDDGVNKTEVTYTVETKDSLFLPEVTPKNGQVGFWAPFEFEYDNEQVVEAEYLTPGSDITYTLNDDQQSYTLTSAPKDITEAIVLPYYEGKPVTSIADYAFCACEKLEKITFVGNSKLQRIGAHAFEDCKRLTDITIPASVSTIGELAFFNCLKLIISCEIDSYIPGWDSNWNGSGGLVIWDCKNNNLAIDNAAYVVVGNIRYQIKDNVAKVALFNYKGNVVIPDDIEYDGNQYPITGIAYGAFSNCDDLISVVVPATVTSIGSNAFYYSEKLQYVTFKGDSKLEKIEFSAFQGCSNLLAIELSDSVSSIEQSAFKDCKNLQTVTFEGGNKLHSIESWVFSGCGNLLSINIPSSVTTIDERAFYECGSLQEVTLEEDTQLNSIGKEAFYNCRSLQSFDMPSGIASIGEYAFYGCRRLETVVIPGNIEKIEGYAFAYCENLQTVTFVDKGKLQTIEYGAFTYCSKLASITIPSSVTSIGSYAFADCTGLKTVMFAEDSKLQVIDRSAFWDSGLTSIIIPNDVTIIGSGAFYSCGVLKEVTFEENSQLETIESLAFYGCSRLPAIIIPSSVTSIGEEACSNCANLKIYCEAASKPLDWDENWKGTDNLVLWDCQGTTVVNEMMYAVLHDKTAVVVDIADNVPSTLVIPQTIQYGGENYIVTKIFDRLFENFDKLTEISLPESITEIGANAFVGCKLKRVSFGENSKLQVIGDAAFAWCGQLESIDLPDSVTSLGEGAFFGCSILISVVLPKNLTNIGDSVFYFCNDLSVVTIPGSVTNMGHNVFYDSRHLTIYCESAGQPDGWSDDWNVQDYPVVWNCIGSAAVDGVVYVISSNKTAAAVCATSNAVEEIHLLQTVQYADESYSVTQIAQDAFAWHDSLSSITISSSVTSIGNRAIEYCQMLQTVIFEDDSQLQYIGDNAFYQCTSLTSFTIPSRVISIGYQAILGCDMLVSITIPSSVISIGDDAFGGDNTTLYCEAATQPEGWNGFWNRDKCPVVWDCKNNDVANDGYMYTFVNGIRYQIKDSHASVTQYEYSGEVVIPYSVEYKGREYTVTGISDEAFAYCRSLVSVSIPSGVTQIGEWAFADCERMSTVTFEGNSQLRIIGAYAFESCDDLTSIILSNYLTYIGEEAFYDCGNLPFIVIPLSVSTIGQDAFYGCDNIMIYCEAYGASQGWDENWNSSRCPITWESSGKTTLDGVEYNLKPNRTAIVAKIVDESLSQITLCEQVEFCKRQFSVTKIETQVFSNCGQLTSITIPHSINNVELSAFGECTNLQAVYYEGTMDDWCRIEFEDAFANPMSCASQFFMKQNDSWQEVTEIIIPESVRNIRAYQFYGFVNVTSITIHGSVTYVGYGAFAGCINLTIYCEAETQPEEWNEFWNPSNCPVLWGYKGEEE